MATDVVIAVGTRGVSAAARSITRLEERSSKFGKVLAGTVVGGSILAAAAVGKFAAASVRAASSSQQSLGATETVYGRYARTVIRESKRADDALGLSANEYRELANVSGAMLKSSGIPLRKVTALTADLEKRAADVAATFGGSTREAVEAFNAVLRGETDPVERYGVSIKQTDVNARLAAKGQDKLTGAAAKQAGALARLDLLFAQTSSSSGQFARESDTLAGAQQRLDAKVENVQARFGKLLLPVLSEGVNLISRKVIPAAEDLAGWLEQNSAEIERTGRAVADGLLPPLQTLGGMAAAAARFVGGLPPQVQSLAAQAAVAAVVLPRLSAALDAIQLREFTSDLASAETRTKALGKAARTAAGIGGVLALSAATQESNNSLQLLESTAGGALLGFQIGGPWGAAIGTGAGALIGLATATSESATQMVNATDKAKAFARSLDETSGAATRATGDLARTQITERLGSSLPIVTRSLRVLGLGMRDLIGFTLGEDAATKRLNGAIRENANSRNGTVRAAAQQLNLQRQFLQGDREDFQEGRRLARQRIQDLTSWKQAIAGMPKGVKVALRNEGYRPTLKEIRDLKRQYDLTPRQVRTLIRLTGAGAVEKQAKGARDELERAGRVKPDTTPWLKGLTSALTSGKATAGRGAEGIARELGRGTKNAKADVSPFNSSLRRGITTAKQSASSGGKQTGNALGQGMYGGVDAWSGPIAARAAAIVSAAVRAARAAADAHSPSRKTMQLGDDMGSGLAIGLARSAPKVKVASFGIIQALVEGLTGTDSGSPVDSAIGDVVSKVERLYEGRLQQTTKRLGSRFDRLGAQVKARFDANEKRIRKNLKGDAEEKALRNNDNRRRRAEQALQKAQQLAERKLTAQNTAQRKAALAIVTKYTPALRANALEQESLNRQLEEGRAALAQLQEQRASYIAQVRDNVVSFGSIIGLGEGTGFGSVDQMLSQLRAKVAQAREYADLIKSLEAAGLNDTSIQQLIDAGVGGGLGTAQAIASGGAAAISELNDLTAQLTAVGTDLGTTMADTLASEYNAAGIAGAQGLVDGLASQQAAAVAEGNRLAAALDAELARATALTAAKNRGHGQNIGRQLVAGLLDGIDGNQAAVDRAARRLGNALVRAVKDELGIKSPSRVFTGIGENVVKGLDLGLDDTYVRRSGAQMAAALQKGFAAPRFEAMVTAAADGTAGIPVQIVVQVPPTADKAAIGREIASALKEYVGAGGRVVTG